MWKWHLFFFSLLFLSLPNPSARVSASPFFLFCMFPASVQTRPRARVSCSGRELNALRCWEPPAFLSPPASAWFRFGLPCEAKYSISARGSRFLAEMASCASMSRPGTPEHWEAAPELVSNGPMGWCVFSLRPSSSRTHVLAGTTYYVVVLITMQYCY